MSQPNLITSEGEIIELQSHLPTILLVDDMISNLELLEDIFEGTYNLPTAQCGKDAWELLISYPELFDMVLLDRMMPDILGDEVMKRMKGHSDLKLIPIAFQTAKTSKQDIKEGLALGADYYITKPYEQQQLYSITKTAVGRYSSNKQRFREIEKAAKRLNAFSLLESGQFVFSIHTIEEAEQLSYMLAHICPNPNRTVLGLLELCYNAIEYGIAQMTYEDKTIMVEEGTWLDKVKERLNNPENINKSVKVQCTIIYEEGVSYNRENIESIQFLIKDPGPGFDHKKFMCIDPERIFDNHGRGISMGAALSLDEVHYNEKGNEVRAVVKVSSQKEVR